MHVYRDWAKRSSQIDFWLNKDQFGQTFIQKHFFVIEAALTLSDQ